MYVNKKKIFKLEVNGNIGWPNICLGSVSSDFTKDEQEEISLNDTVFDFSVDYNSIKKEDILNIHEYLMVKNNVK